ncbi:hypothetical protein SORBI_3003G072700 [Sorghum bicolor]|uniref:Uncharacterized protein n=1 Tax=Sorghum bicolor TaxID=4558 RepID=A0A1B6Q1V7_SORBI|nr:hypothetical protein SORBI_3003G072700 [Sorghum bicolor]
MASTATGRAGAGVTEKEKAEWWRCFSNGVPVDDGDDKEEEEEEGERGGAERTATYAVAGREEAEMQMEPGDGSAETVARGVEAEMVARGGGKAETEAEGVGGKRWSSPRFADPAALSGGNSLQLAAELPRRRRKVIAKRTRLNVDGTEVQTNISQVVKGSERVYEENENLRLQLALKTTELKQEENRRLQLELIIKSKETESLQKQIEDLKAENEQLRKNVKPQRVERKCRYCNAYVMHDYRNCPKRRRAASSPEVTDGEEEDSY